MSVTFTNLRINKKGSLNLTKINKRLGGYINMGHLKIGSYGPFWFSGKVFSYQYRLANYYWHT